jgi:drug/metabolite transporter (DMT)-like permease
MPVPKTKWIPILEALFAVSAWGASFIATKIALRDVSPATVVWLRFAMGLVILGATVAARKQFSIPDRREWGYFVLLGFLGIALHQWLQSNGLQTSRASTSAWIVATTPVFMALLAWLVLGEGLDWLKSLGILLAGLGVLLVVSAGDLAGLSIGRFGAPGDFLILISSLNWAVVSILSRRALQKHPAAAMTFWMMLAGWLFSSALFLAGNGLHEVPRLTTAGWLALSFLGVFCSGLAYIAWFDALKALTAARLGAFLYIEPLVAMFVAALLLHESITLAAMLGGGIILLGVYLVNRDPE